MMPSIMSGSLIRETPPWARMSAGTRSSAITATAPASSAIFACSAVTTSMITPPLSISAMPRLTRAVPVPGASAVLSGVLSAMPQSYGRPGRAPTRRTAGGTAGVATRERLPAYHQDPLDDRDRCWPAASTQSATLEQDRQVEESRRARSSPGSATSRSARSAMPTLACMPERLGRARAYDVTAPIDQADQTTGTR